MVSTCLVPETWEETLTGKTMSSCSVLHLSTATKIPCRRAHEKPTQFCSQSLRETKEGAQAVGIHREMLSLLCSTIQSL